MNLYKILLSFKFSNIEKEISIKYPIIYSNKTHNYIQMINIKFYLNDTNHLYLFIAPIIPLI